MDSRITLGIALCGWVGLILTTFGLEWKNKPMRFIGQMFFAAFIGMVCGLLTTNIAG